MKRSVLSSGVVALIYLSRITAAEENQGFSRETYLLSRLCQWVLISFMFDSLSGASEERKNRVFK